jgi:hypothetical protein
MISELDLSYVFSNTFTCKDLMPIFKPARILICWVEISMHDPLFSPINI